MKLQDVGNTLIKNIKVKLPENYRESANQFGDSVNEEVWLVGPMMGDWFVKNDREKTQVFPLFTEFILWEELKNWEVVEIYKE